MKIWSMKIWSMKVRSMKVWYLHVWPVTRLRVISGSLLAAAIMAGTMSDELNPPAPIELDGYRVLAVDFHVHASVFGDGAVAPWDMPREAQRQGLDAFALTSHNQVWTAKLGRWLARWTGGATVLVGEEVQSAHYHLIAVGIHRTVSWKQPAASAIDDVHNQGGIAIAAHPTAQYSRGWDAAAMGKLDGSEIMHPLVFFEGRFPELRAFYEEGGWADVPHLRLRAGEQRSVYCRSGARPSHGGLRSTGPSVGRPANDPPSR